MLFCTWITGVEPTNTPSHTSTLSPTKQTDVSTGQIQFSVWEILQYRAYEEKELTI